jgi:uncharacterized protein
VRITYDPGKRDQTLLMRGLDFQDAAKVFAGLTLTLPDERQDYGEDRYQTYGLLDGGWSWWYGLHAAKIAT